MKRKLFERDKSTISRHIKNVFDEGELQRDTVVANFATTAAVQKNLLRCLQTDRCRNDLRALR